jgi:hypothetical protein
MRAIRNAGLCVILLTALVAAPTGAQTGADDAQHLAGSWQFTTTPDLPIPPYGGLITFSRDGTLISSGATLVPMPTGMLTFSPGHGAWKRIGNRQFAFKFVVLLHDAGTGAPAGRAEVAGTIALEDGTDGFTGAGTAADYDMAGNLMFGFSAELSGSRIRP